MQASRAVNVAGLRMLAQRRLPRVVFDCLGGGAEDEVPMRANTAAFEAVAESRGAAVIATRNVRKYAKGPVRAATPRVLLPEIV